jgi:protein disulfide-isomerase
MRKYLLTACIFALSMTPAFAAGQNGTNSQQRQSQSANQNTGQIQWYTNYNEALGVAKKANKPLLLFFTGSDWCGWCKKMHQEVFSSADFAQAAGNDFIFVDIDFPMNKPLPSQLQQQNNMLKQKYGVTGYPTIIILDSNSNFIAETGYRPGGGKAYADYLNQLLK